MAAGRMKVGARVGCLEQLVAGEEEEEIEGAGGTGVDHRAFSRVSQKEKQNKTNKQKPGVLKSKTGKERKVLVLWKLLMYYRLLRNTS